MDDSDFMFEEESNDVSDRELNRLRDFHSKVSVFQGIVFRKLNGNRFLERSNS